MRHFFLQLLIVLVFFLSCILTPTAFGVDTPAVASTAIAEDDKDEEEAGEQEDGAEEEEDDDD